MSIKASKAVIGAFVLGALALVIAAVIFFGSTQLFVPQKRYVMYFDGSVKGLSVGAPVVFRGVKIGSVSDIVLRANLQEMTFRVPVIAEVDLSRFQMDDGQSIDSGFHQSLIERGLRAQLQTQSLLTGQLMVNFDFYPDTPARLVEDRSDDFQVPTIPSTAHQLAQRLEDLPLEQLVERTNSLVGGLNRLINSEQMQELPGDLTRAAAQTTKTMEGIDRELGLLSAQTRKSLEAATGAMQKLDGLLDLEDGPSGELVTNLNRTLVEARGSIARFDKTLDAVNQSLPAEQSRYRLRHALKELEETSSALGALIEYLDRRPEALLRGRTEGEGK